jgi:predicted nucleic acid-binding protein
MIIMLMGAWTRSRMPSDRAAVFLDTAYISALVNTRDQWHKTAVQWEEQLSTSRRMLVTSEFVLVEIADALAAVKFRLQAAAIIAALQASPLVEIVPATSALFEAASAMYKNRADKDWGLTDCSSFVIMTERGLSEALTTDTHFRQAGYRALLLEAVRKG